ncbi:MAG: glycoside hydrolase family 38 C-terminal domain-containing protein [Firmicutes bacterium]|nr:glycoside hydrolase family 38 C-terminal domain-containing protein [Bacillota bacterium]
MRLNVIKRRFEEFRRQAFLDITPLPKMRRTTSIYESPGVYKDQKESSDITIGEVWAKPTETAFLSFNGDFWQEDHWFDISLGSEACLFVDGVPYAGLDENHRLIPIPKGVHEYKIEAFNKSDTPKVLLRAHVIFVNKDLDLLTNLALEAVKLAEKSDPIIANAFEEVFTKILVSFSSASDFDGAVKEALATLDTKLRKYEHNKLPGKLVLIPQSHIDLAWLWPEKETVRKISRTFSTALRLGELYDEFIYHQSQPQLFSHAKTYYPKLYTEIKKAVRSGKFKLVGGMWVEPDCNMPSGEAFVRQLLYGKKFFKEEFGCVPTVEWLPDVFGFSPSLPQLFVDSGTKAFMTIKTGWNDTNKMPDCVFNWRGIDGTSIPVFIPKALNEDVTAPDVIQAMENSKRTTILPVVAHLIGYGDGGGGVTIEQMNKGRLLSKLPALPEVEFGDIDSYVQDNIIGKPIKHTWDGELYLELHRGTTTSQARNKKWNRKLEFKVRDVEILSAFSHAIGSEYPKTEIEKAWKVILKNQMHDILPGSSIREVYEKSEKDYLEVDRDLNKLKDKVLEDLAKNIEVVKNDNTMDNIDLDVKKRFVVFNTVSFARKTLIKIAGLPKNASFINHKGKVLLSQRLKDGNTLVEVDLPEMGYTTIDMVINRKSQVKPSSFTVSEAEFDNGLVSVSFGEFGNVTEIKDLEIDEVVIKNSKHHLQFFDDRPLVWDAWEIDADYAEVSFEPEKLISFKLKENGPICTSFEASWKVNQSTITQEIALYQKSKRVDFKTKVDWQEKHVLLKTIFDTKIRSRYATFDVAFGKYQRPTFQNTTWERAQYEVSAHKWADLSDGSHGVSLLNDCKYGYNVGDQTLGLSLLRAPTYPDKDADNGSHEFTYSVLLHEDVSCQKTIKEAYDLNLESLVKEIPTSKANGIRPLPKKHSFIELKSQGVFLDTIKLAEKSNDYIFRFFESLGRREVLKVNSGLKLIDETDLLENSKNKEGTNMIFGPYKVKTFIGRLDL